jgi:hypothetical protein
VLPIQTTGLMLSDAIAPILCLNKHRRQQIDSDGAQNSKKCDQLHENATRESLEAILRLLILERDQQLRGYSQNFTLIKQIAVRSSPTFSVGMGVAPMAWQHRKDVVFTPKGERIALPMLGCLPVFPPPLDDQIEHGNKEQIQHR